MNRSALTLGLTILLSFPVCYGSTSAASWFVDYQPEYGTCIYKIWVTRGWLGGKKEKESTCRLKILQENLRKSAIVRTG